jgi:hypothetical protein
VRVKESMTYFFVLTTVALVLIWWDDHKLARERLRVALTEENNRGIRTSVEGGPCLESSRMGTARSIPQNDTSL